MERGMLYALLLTMCLSALLFGAARVSEGVEGFLAWQHGFSRFRALSHPNPKPLNPET